VFCRIGRISAATTAGTDNEDSYRIHIIFPFTGKLGRSPSFFLLVRLPVAPC
jgi:hypothetical protein